MIIMIKLINVLLGKKITLTKDKSKLFITQITMMFFLSFVVIFCMNLLNQPSNNSKSNSKTENNQTTNNKNKTTKGKKRAIKFSTQWKKADLNKNIKKFAGKNSKVSTTETGKTIYKNQKTGMQLVVDKAGKYFRIQNTKLTGKRCYLDLNGKIPNNKIINGKIIGNSQAEYNQLTHFLFE